MALYAADIIVILASVDLPTSLGKVEIARQRAAEGAVSCAAKLCHANLAHGGDTAFHTPLALGPAAEPSTGLVHPAGHPPLQAGEPPSPQCLADAQCPARQTHCHRRPSAAGLRRHHDARVPGTGVNPWVSAPA